MIWCPIGRAEVSAHAVTGAPLSTLVPIPTEDLKTKFANQLAGVLAQRLEQKFYDRLIIVASPVTLGDLRTAISPQVRPSVVGEIAQDLTKLPNDEVAGHIKHVLII